jgi:hypothetical protein
MLDFGCQRPNRQFSVVRTVELQKGSEFDFANPEDPQAKSVYDSFLFEILPRDYPLRMPPYSYVVAGRRFKLAAHRNF